MKWLRWRWRLWRAQHYEWEAWVTWGQNHGNDSYGQWHRAKERVAKIRMEKP